MMFLNAIGPDDLNVVDSATPTSRQESSDDAHSGDEVAPPQYSSPAPVGAGLRRDGTLPSSVDRRQPHDASSVLKRHHPTSSSTEIDSGAVTRLRLQFASHGGWRSDGQADDRDGPLRNLFNLLDSPFGVDRNTLQSAISDNVVECHLCGLRVRKSFVK